ncbi:DUF2062 domain-containing protein [Emcibacter sp. SYSU 3D8]|uniref:DUF2062 domain-containing protein n=1 Tax=Emcibacter sp. SYSU 3D8 TaxID=3133969 RepID=UPI0031FEA04D
MRGHRWLRWLGPKLHHPRLWHLSRRGVALGCAIGVFFGLLIPVAQIPLSAAAALALRANLPAAVVSTLVSNPVTFGPIYYFAYRVGEAVTGVKARPLTAETLTPKESGLGEWLRFWWHYLDTLGKPLITGLLLMAVVSSALTYALVSGLWRLTTILAWRKRPRRPKPPPDAP